MSRVNYSKIELSRKAFTLLRKLGDTAGANWLYGIDGRTCRPLEALGLMKSARSKDGVRIKCGRITKRGRNYLMALGPKPGVVVKDANAAIGPANVGC